MSATFSLVVLLRARKSSAGNSTHPSLSPPASNLLFYFYRLETAVDPAQHALPVPSRPAGEALFRRRHRGALPAHAAALPPCTAPGTMVGLRWRRPRSASRLSAPGGPESAAVRAGPDGDTGTHCGEMSKRTSLSSHSTSSAPLMAATRPDESARRRSNGGWGAGGWGLGSRGGRDWLRRRTRGARAHSRPPWLRPRLG